MQVFTTKKLIENIERKGINIDRKDKKKFTRYNYYQVINAYKNIFVNNVENIDDIMNNILQGKEIERYNKYFGLPNGLEPNDMILNICRFICKKYDRQPIKEELEDYLYEIREMDYYHHIYSARVRYSDFIRMYKFEHELRTVILRYVLIIEESLKNIFVSYLNNTKVSDSFLMDISNYRSESKSINESIDSIKLVLEKQKNKYSKPISRKKFQKINVPYWIIINELTIKETLKIINNLEENHYINIYKECLKQFTKLNIDDAQLSKEVVEQYIDQMRNLLEIIANFRNLLAHNQPLYLFNVKDTTTKNSGEVNYDYPRVKNQDTMNSDTMSVFAKFFGSDRYNSRTQNIKIDLSWIIYVIYKIISTLDTNNHLYEEIKNVFKKYSIVSIEDNKVYNDVEDIKELLKEIDNFLEYNFNSNEITDIINNGKAYKSIIKHKEVEIRKMQHDMKSCRKKINNLPENKKYNIFQFINKYTEYTGIDKSYFDKLK